MFLRIEQMFLCIEQMFVSIEHTFWCIEHTFRCIEQMFLCIEQMFVSIEQMFLCIEQMFVSIEQMFVRIENTFWCIEQMSVSIKMFPATCLNNCRKAFQLPKSHEKLAGARLQRVPFIILFFVQLLILLSFYIIYHSPFFVSFARVANARERGFIFRQAGYSLPFQQKTWSFLQRPLQRFCHEVYTETHL